MIELILEYPDLNVNVRIPYESVYEAYASMLDGGHNEMWWEG